jgi:hypothetical protein
MLATCLADWLLPLACIAVILLSIIYTHHNYNRLLRESSETQLLQNLASMQIMGILLAAAALSAAKAATSSFQAKRLTRLPAAAARRRAPVV